MAPSGRLIGRILSLGFPFPGSLVDNYTFISAPAFFDYDAIVVEPSALSRLIESVVAGEAAETFTGRPVRNVAEGVEDVTLAEVLLRRRDETRRAIERGVLIVCFLHQPVAHRNIAGLPAFDDYDWLPEDVACGLRARLVPGEGSRVQVVDFQHPLAEFVHSQLANISYRAHIDSRGEPPARVFARSHGGAVVGAEVAFPDARIVLLPALHRHPSGDDRYAMAGALQAGIRRALGVMAEGRAPTWVASRALPGLDHLARSVDDARAALRETQAAADAAGQAHDEIERYHRLLWQEGALGLDDVVIEALRLTGFDVYANDPNAIELRADGAEVLVEIEGSDASVDMAPHHRLRQRIEQAIEKRGFAPRGIIFVNGRRLDPPETRGSQVSDGLRLAAETMHYAIVPTAMLFDAIAAQLGGDAAAVAAFRKRVVTEDGVLA